MPRTLQYATVSSGNTASAAFRLPDSGERIGIFLPSGITSCTALLEASRVDTTTAPSSADFVRVHNPVGSGQFIFYPGPGPAALRADALFPPVAWGRVAFSVGMAPTSLAIVLEA